MFSVIATHNKTSVGVNFYLVDNYSDLSDIKTRSGSKAYVIENGKTYLLAHNGEWTEYYPALKKYIDDKFSNLDISPEMLEELRILVDQIENGNIDQLIIDKIKEMNLVSANDVETILKEKNYISYNDTEEIVFYGGNSATI